MEQNKNDGISQTPAVKIDPKLRFSGMINSGILAVFFLVTALAQLASGQTFMGIIGILATIGTVNDTLKFYYANKGN